MVANLCIRQPLCIWFTHTYWNHMKKLITVLEDDKDIREICAYLFADEGYSVQEFADIASFTRASTSPSLFLLDIQLPDGNGLDVCKNLKNNPIYSKIPIIMMSAHLKMNAMMENCRADDFIEKPFDIDLLLKRVARLL